MFKVFTSLMHWEEEYTHIWIYWPCWHSIYWE